MNKIVLDTNAYTHLFKEKDSEVLVAVNCAEKIYFSSIVLGELLYGFSAGTRLLHNRRRLTEFLSKETVEVTSITKDTAEIYGELKHILRVKGLPLPGNDVWIAASAIEYGAVLVTFDTHFLAIPGLRLWDRLKFKN